MSKCYSRDPKVRIEFEAREKALKDKTSALNYAKSEGHAEGQAEGIKIGEANTQAKVEEVEAIAQAKIEEAKAEAGKAHAQVKEATLNNKIENAKNLLDILDDETIADSIGLEVSQVARLREEFQPQKGE